MSNSFDNPTPEQGDIAETASGVSRRNVLRGGGAGVASAVVLGLGIGREAGPAAASSAGASTAAAAPASANLRSLDPHAFTARSIVSRHPSYLQAEAEGKVALRIIPIDRAHFLVNSLFDLRVEATGVDPHAAKIEIDVDGPADGKRLIKGSAIRTSSVANSLEVTYRDVYYAAEGTYTITATVTDGGTKVTEKVTHDVVVAKAPKRPAKNVIFFLGDGMGQPAITSARIMSKGISEGRYHGMLNMDEAEYRGWVTTSGYDSIATDSANSMSAYMTGHKSSVNAMGVYESNAPEFNQHPHVETMAEMVNRGSKRRVGIVTTAEMQDATPTAVHAHTRRRAEKLDITDQMLANSDKIDVWLGGGRAFFTPEGTKGSKRKDSRDLRAEFQKKGYTYVEDRKGLKKAGAPEKLFGAFHDGNMSVYLDREVTKHKETLGGFEDQPTLMEMTESALAVLEQKKGGFFLMVEAASIDKMEHPQDGPRVTYDTIEFDQAIGVAREWAKKHGDTLIVVTADHNHSMSIVGTHDKRSDASPDREANGVYADAGFPTYVDSNGDGFPDSPDVDIQLFYGWSNHPDHHDDFEFNPVFMQPALNNKTTGKAEPNPKRDGDSQLQIGNLPYEENNCVHTVEDVSIMAFGPGAQNFNAVLDNTDVFIELANAMQLRLPRPAGARARAKA